MIRESKSKYVLISIIAAMIVLVFDLSLPLGVAGGVPYVAFILTGIWYSKRRHIIYLALIATALTIAGYYLSPPGSETWIVLINRSLTIFAIWITALLIIYTKTADKARQNSEERFRHFSELASEGIIISDKGKYLDSNKAVETILGYSHSEFLSLQPKNLITEQDLASVMDHMINNIEDKYQVTAIKKDGTLFPAEIRARMIKRHGKILRVTFFNDITERVKSQENLRHALTKADEANKAKSEFLASMSHELRTPLNAVIGFAQMLQFDPQNPLNEAQNGHVDSILKGGAHLLELVNEVLDLARIEADRIDLSLDEINPGEVIDNCVKLSAPLGHAHNIKIIDEFSNNSKVRLRTDKIRLKQIIINLLSNAIKFNKENGTVTITGQETENGFLRISVTDTGIGIAKKDHGKIFHKFNRLNVDPLIFKEGTGIGLTVCQLLVERMAGKIGFDSGENLGSTFWFELPLSSNPHALIWTAAMRTDVDVIDNDHQKLIILLNKASNLDADDPQITEIIYELIDYTEYHFKREERVMEICQYPDIENHKKLHANLMTRVGKLTVDFQNNQTTQSPDLLRHFLRDWLFNHIMKEDIKITPYARGKSAKIRHALNDVHQSTQPR